MYSPFSFPRFRKLAEKKHAIKIVNTSSRSDIIMSSYLSVLRKYAQKYGKKKKYLLWTHEPYHDYTLKSKVKNSNGSAINIMNCYTGDVFCHNFRYFYFKQKIPNFTSDVLKQQDLTIFELCQKQNQDKNIKPIVALSTFYPTNYYQKNPHSTLPLRYQLIEKGYQFKCLDVYGKNWEQHDFVRSIENSRNRGDRRETKAVILQKYYFNLCLENMNFKYYVTEKIWEPIQYHSLPIYYSNDSIYEVFPKNSFVDYRDFENPEELYDYLKNMTCEEYETRLNRCIDSFNNVIDQKKNIIERGKSSNMNINYLEYDTCFHELVKKVNSI